VPQPCRSVQSASEFTVRAIKPSGVVLLEHPRRGVAEPERNEDGGRTDLQRQRSGWLSASPEILAFPRRSPRVTTTLYDSVNDLIPH